MLDKLLGALKRGGTVTVDQVARELDTTPEVVGGMIDHLTRTGQLQPMSVICESSCSECMLVNACRKTPPSPVWRAAA